MIDVNGQIWIGSSHGLALINIKDKKQVEHELVDQFKNIYIHDLDFGKEMIFIGTESGLYIFDTKNQKLYDAKSFGYKTKEFIYPIKYGDFTAIAQNKHYLYVGPAYTQ